MNFAKSWRNFIFSRKVSFGCIHVISTWSLENAGLLRLIQFFIAQKLSMTFILFRVIFISFRAASCVAATAFSLISFR